ncbi:MAG: YgiQ family radical SAM protein [Clostridia bacterium]|nr:YgiQ family radical SAM protein [Clostridia bacterium]
MAEGFLPLNRKEMREKGWQEVDFVYVCGDAYVDHPSFGAAIICRLLERHGFKVGLLCQPDWKDPDSMKVYGEPRLGFLVSSGNMDSMVNHYSVTKHRRKVDAYSPGGQTGRRPDRAVIVYGNLIRQAYPDTAIIAGGLEASLRRLGHYDYWDDRVRRSILLDASADLVSYGMGEHSIIEIAEALDSGIPVGDVTFIDGTVYKNLVEEDIYDAIRLPDYAAVSAANGATDPHIAQKAKKAYARSFQIQYENTDPVTGRRLYEAYEDGWFVVQNPPAKPLTMQEMDDVYALPYMRAWHPSYEKAGGIPAFSEIKFSLTSNRGCYGECNFCALTFHEGRVVQARSHESILEEAKGYREDPDFKGYIHDVGGPTAEFRRPACKKQLTLGACKDRHCLYPTVCPNLDTDHSDYLELLRKLRTLPGVKRVFVRSGIRYDVVLADHKTHFLKELAEHHVSGQLRVAPEHVSDAVLSKIGKPSVNVYNQFVKEFEKVNAELGKDQYVVPYLISSHPGSKLRDAIALAEYLNRHKLSPKQVQDFYPTPGTVSTCMYYTGYDPLTMNEVFVARDPHEKAMQRALIQYRDPKNFGLVREALTLAHRTDLIGYGPGCLVPPAKPNQRKTSKEKHR